MKLPRVPQRTTTGFAFSAVDRALKEGFARRRFGQAEIQRVLAFFAHDPPECVYCGESRVRRWDHVVPVTKGGETVLGNIVPACARCIVPACARCDDSKGDLPFDEWMLGDARFSPKSRGVVDVEGRIARIQAYVQHFGYTPSDVLARLTEEEAKKLQSIRADLGSVRADIEDLIADYRARTDDR